MFGKRTDVGYHANNVGALIVFINVVLLMYLKHYTNFALNTLLSDHSRFNDTKQTSGRMNINALNLTISNYEVALANIPDCCIKRVNLG